MKPFRSMAVLCASLLASAAAEACSFVPRQPELRPYYAHLVATAHSIDLMRVVSVQISAFEDPGPDVDYIFSRGARVSATFTSAESLKGSGSDLEFNFIDGLPAEAWQSEEAGPDDEYEDGLHTDPSFWSVFDMYDTPVTPGCEVIYPRFQEGELYVVLRDQEGSPLDMLEVFGRNFQRITDTDDDAWLNALRVLSSPDSPPYGRRVNIRDFVQEFGVAAVHDIKSCGNWRIGRNRSLDTGRTLYLDQPNFDLDSADLLPGHHWSTGLIYGDDGRRCTELNDTGEVVGRMCPDTTPPDCHDLESYLLLPAKSFDLDSATQHYWTLGFPVDAAGIVDFSEWNSEVELTGDLQQSLDHIERWMREVPD